MSDYTDMEDFAAHVSEEGIEYYFCDYTDPEEVRIAGVALPEEIVQAAKDLEKAVSKLRAWIPEA